MSTFLLVLCIISLTWWLELALEWSVAAASSVDLAGQPVPNDPVPRLSVVIPARNEERTLEKALTSVLAALPDNGEAILVNDRSTDETGTIAARLAKYDRRLMILTISDLPDGWLGKTHAMWNGYQITTGDYLLFADADVIFEPSCLIKAVAYCEKEKLDHLVAAPKVVARGFWERTFVSFFTILLMARYRIWRAANPRSGFYAGIGAFNMVKREPYEKAGTHEALKWEALDDLFLGRLLKRSGARSKVVAGNSCLKVRWNAGLRGLIEGMEKNSFAAFDYSLPRVAVCTFTLFSGTVVPMFAPVCLGIPGRNAPLLLAGFTGLIVWGAFVVLYRLASYPNGISWL
jgi:glycosyltransferase involved in cell wall biosynthesis